MEHAEFSLDLPLADLPGMPDKHLRALTTLGLATPRDLLGHYPRRYEDRRRFDLWPTGASHQPVCIHGMVTDAMTKRFGSGRNQSYFEIVLEPVDGFGMASPVYCRWFNMPFMKKALAAGHELVLYGQPKLTSGKLTIAHPDYEIIEPGGDMRVHMERIVPIYPASSGTTQRFLRGWTFRSIERLDAEPMDETLPLDTVRAIDPDFVPPDRRWAIKQIHFPDTMENMEAAQEYLALEEFVAQQIQVLRRKKALQKLTGAAHCGEGDLLSRFLKLLPFQLTGAQTRCIEEVRRDLASSYPMNRLLQGDVGAGKTMVAFAAVLFAVEAGYQAAIMAPTQILAEQHYLNFLKYADKLELRVSLRTSGRGEDNFSGEELLVEPLAPHIIVGTHALIHDKVKFEKLGLVVIDEQHKFGVSQREKLANQGANPDMLVMTATPIPRTLTMTAYGDLDVSILDELPAGRGKIITAIRETTKTQQAAAFIKQHLENGRQAYIVYPLVEEGVKKSKSMSATQEFQAWSRRLAPFKCELLHGKVSNEEKERTMGAFRAGEIQVLVATTVIEVGVDVPNANLMLIYNAERFGLAQLHQLRGRIGRGEHKSYCILMCDPEAEEAVERLKIMETTLDGFKIAEEDLKIRGPGDVLGTKQSGLPDLQFASKLADTRLVTKARDIAQLILERDPELELLEHWKLRELTAVKERVAPQVA